MLYGLSDNTLDQLKQLFGNYDQVNEVILYGSRAKGNYHEGSDIDLAIKGISIEFDLLQKIKNNIDNLLLPYLVDITIFHHL